MYAKSKKEKKVKIYIYFKKDLKTCNDFVSLYSIERLFHTLAPLYQKLFCSTAGFLKRSLKSVVVFRRLHTVKCYFLVKILYIYSGPNSLRDLKTIVFIPFKPV